MQNNFRTWRSKEKNIDNMQALIDFENLYKLTLPDKYKKLVRSCDGGILEKDTFSYKWGFGEDENCVGRFLRWQPHDDVDYYLIDDKKVSKKFFRQGLEPITYEGNGDWLCFDYTSKQDLPPVITYHREIGYNEILDEIQNLPEFFPKGLIPFSQDGGGNYLCFDYRNCTENPPIVFWHHAIEENEGIFHLADSFEEFISSLKSEEELDD